jgi:hypothetical protein
MTKKKTSINSNVRIKISQKEKIANDFFAAIRICYRRVHNTSFHIQRKPF